MKLRRWASAIFISGYILALSWGVIAHAMKFGLVGNTISYYLVWDMFCGWSAYDNRTHIVAEDSSGQFYRVREPWGAFTPFSDVDRVNYDVSNNLTPRHIQHVLAHTSHPPIDRVYVVEEIWGKQYNVPDRLWSYNFLEPKEKTSYFNLRAICNARGTLIDSYPSWFTRQTLQAIADNPRLQRESSRGTQYLNTFFNPSRQRIEGATFNKSDDLGLNTN